MDRKGVERIQPGPRTPGNPHRKETARTGYQDTGQADGTLK